MSSYGRTSSNAIAIASLLAERWTAKTRTTSQEASKIRGISKPLAARILVQLAQMGLVEGTPGPHGGYILSRAPRDIRLSEIVSVFQRVEADERCAYGPGWCGNGNPCPLHDELTRLASDHLAFLERTTLNVFVGKSPIRDTPPATSPPTTDTSQVASETRRNAKRAATSLPG